MQTLHILFLYVNQLFHQYKRRFKRKSMKKIVSWCLVFGLIVYTHLLNASQLAGYELYRELEPIKKWTQEGTLLLSNSPETIKQTGILYQDEMQGIGRLVFHHVNQTNHSDKKLVIIAENTTEDNQMLRICRKAVISPHYHYLKAGEQVLKDYFHHKIEQIYFLSPYQKIVLYDSGETSWPIQTVQSGMMDLETTGIVRITFAMLERGDSMDQIEALKPLKKDKAPRGTFKYLAKQHYVVLPTDTDSYYLIEKDKKGWIQGIDALTQEKAINYGNYGIMYKITLMAMADTQVFICPRGGIFQGMVRWEDGQITEIKRPHVFKVNKERIPIGQLKQGEIKTLEYFLPNGSAAPILLGFKVSQ